MHQIYIGEASLVSEGYYLRMWLCRVAFTSWGSKRCHICRLLNILHKGRAVRYPILSTLSCEVNDSAAIDVNQTFLYDTQTPPGSSLFPIGNPQSQVNIIGKGDLPGRAFNA